MSVLDTAARLIPPDAMRVALRQSPDYVINRNRVAVLVHDGLSAYDTYNKLKPALFIGGLLGAAASGYAFEKRGRKPKNPEAMALYGGLFAICSALAWFARPGTATVPVDAPPTEEPSSEGGFVNWLDERAAKLEYANPGFADEAMSRATQFPGVRNSFNKMSPLIQAVVV